MAWTDTFDETTDWSAVAHLNMFTNACWERYEAINPGIQAPFPVAAGDDVQAVTFIAGLQGYPPGWVGPPSAGQFGYIRPDFVIEGAAVNTLAGNPYFDLEPWWPDFASVQDAAGYDDSRDAFGRSYANTDAESGWIRKKPRGIANTSVTKDTDGNPISDGMRAYHASTGELYARVSGAWVAASRAGGLADLLTSAPGNPRTITSTSDTTDTAGNTMVGGEKAELGADVYQYDGTTWNILAPEVAADRLQTGTGCAFGFCVAGDYIGPWIWNQLRDVIQTIGNRTDLPTDVAGNLLGTGASHYDSVTGLEPVFTSEAAAWADADARWTTGPGAAGSYAFVYMSSEGTVHSQFPSIVAQAESSSAIYTASTADHVAKTVKFLGAFVRGGSSGSGWLNVYDTQGEDAAPAVDTFHVWESIPVAAGTTDAVSTFVASTTTPPNYTDLPFDDPSNPSYVATSTGFAVSQSRAIVEWTFTQP